MTLILRENTHPRITFQTTGAVPKKGPHPKARPV